MSAIKIDSFTGQIPKLHKRALPNNAAQIAINTRFRDGTMEPLPRAKAVATVPSGSITIYKDGAVWYGWASDVRVARGPVAADRLYFTGDGAPKMRVSGVDYPLALPAPTTAPTVTNASSVTEADDSAEAVLWAYTWVTEFGEESQPSPLSDEIWSLSTVTQTVTGFAATPTGRGITHRRLYRSQTSATGATELLFAAEMPVADASLTFDIIATPLNEAIPSKDYDPPPDDMRGIVTMPNGMMAAFSGQELLFSEPYIPHAWPAKYAMAVDSAIIAIVPFGSSLAVLTTGAPYVAQGLHPSSIAMEKLTTGSPCLSARGVVDLGNAAIYPSVDGLIIISGGQVTNITSDLFSREQWVAMNPQSMIASRFDGSYVFTRVTSAYETYDCGSLAIGYEGTEDIVFETPGATIEDADAYELIDLGSALSAFGTQRIGIIDTSAQSPSFSDADFAQPVALHHDQTSGALYFATEDGVVYEWLASNTVPSTIFWRSKFFPSSGYKSFGAAYVKTGDPVGDGLSMVARVYGDGELVREFTTANAIQRLPGGKQYKEWEIEVATNVRVVSIAIGTTPDETMAALG